MEVGAKWSTDFFDDVMQVTEYAADKKLTHLLNMVGRDVPRDKFRKLARPVLSQERIEQLITAVERLERSNDAAKFSVVAGCLT